MSKAKFLSSIEAFGFCGVVYGWDSECNSQHTSNG